MDHFLNSCVIFRQYSLTGLSVRQILPTLADEDFIKIYIYIYDGKETSTPGNATNDQGLQDEESCTMLNFLLNTAPSQHFLF